MVRDLEQAKPTGLIGLSGAGRLFTEKVLRLMGEHHEQPIIMPMSNPTHRMECTAEDAQRMTGAPVLWLLTYSHCLRTSALGFEGT